jgi:DNA end-binding protein Ku
MRESGTAALGTFVLAGKEKLALIRVRNDALVLETLYAAEDVYSDTEIEEAVSEAGAKKSELALAQQIIDGLAADFDAQTLVHGYRNELRALLEEKLRGAPPVRPEPVEAEEAPVADLMEALRRSVAEAKKRKPPARKASAKKATQPAKAASRTKTVAKKR